MKCLNCQKSISNQENEKFGGLCKVCFSNIPEIRQVRNEMRLKNIIRFSSSHKPIIFYQENGNPFFACYLPEMIEVTQRLKNKFSVYIHFGEGGLQRIGNLIGMGGFYYDAGYWATTPDNIFKAWNWFNQEVEANKNYWFDIEADMVRDFLDNNWDTFSNEINDTFIIDILSLIWDLYNLNILHTDLTKKIIEIKGQAKGRINKYEKLSNNIKFSTNFRFSRDVMKRVTDLRKFLAHLSSESRFAILAKSYGFSIELSDHPDIIINGKKIEIKKPVEKYKIPAKLRGFTVITNESTEIENLSNLIDEGFEQNNQSTDIVAIQVNHLDEREIKGYKTHWQSQATLKTALANALGYTTKDIVLLFKESENDYLGKIIRCKRIKKT